MLTRRLLLGALAAPAILRGAKPTPKQRVDAALRGKQLDRPAYTHWHHFGLESQGPQAHAQATIDYHRRFRTDLVKVMSDFPFPPQSAWPQVAATDNPFPAQMQALELIRAGVGKNAYFVETLFNPWNVAEKLSSKAEVQRLKREQPQVLLDALQVIARAEAAHARRAVQAGASGIFLAIANAQPEIMTRQEFAKFSEPFDRLVLEAVKDAPLNTLHLHGDRVYLEHFLAKWPAAAINYSMHGTGVSLAELRPNYSGVLLGGIDERNYRTLTPEQLKTQWQQAAAGAGGKFILTPGCSVPDQSTAEELERLPKMLKA